MGNKDSSKSFLVKNTCRTLFSKKTRHASLFKCVLNSDLMQLSASVQHGFEIEFYRTGKAMTDKRTAEP